MADRRVNCQVAVPEAIAAGVPVNAFQAVKDGDDWVLDFLVLSEDQTRAVVVSRVRVRPEFLDAVRSRLDSALQVADEPAAPAGNVIPFRRAGEMEVN